MFKLKNKNSSVATGRLKNNLSQRKGFSIGEVLLSVFIVGVSLVVIMQLFSNGMREIMDERDSIIASMLAQEGVELVRNIRDNNWAQRTCPLQASCPDDWAGTFDNLPTSDSAVCRVDITFDKILDSDCGSTSVSNKSLFLDSDGRYSHNSSGTPTKFRRRIGFFNTGTDELSVRSFVSWDGGNPDTLADCTVSNKCVFSIITLRDWGTGS